MGSRITARSRIARYAMIRRRRVCGALDCSIDGHIVLPTSVSFIDAGSVHKGLRGFFGGVP
ncbi:MAG: hypothetical protein WC091_01260 [Sulfuricellaceae bacterium]